MITRLYRIHVHVPISYAAFPGTYASQIHSLGSSPMTYLCTVFPLTLPGYVDVIIQIQDWLQTHNSDSTLLIHP